MTDTEKVKSKGKTFWEKNWLTLVIVLILMIVAIAMCYLLADEKNTPRDTALETLLLTVFSFLSSYLVSKIFAEMSYSQTLRDNGVQIASGIIVLKRQIESLSDWTAQKRLTFKRDEKVDAALEHVQCTLNMFRDMNNAALGGIAGVIGDALAQYETVMRQVSDIRGHALEKTSEIEKEIQIADPGQIKELQAQIKEIEEKSENKILELSRRTVLPIPAEVFKKRFSKACPHCGGINEFEMLDKHGETRTVICEKCGGRFNAHIAAGQGLFTRKLPGYNRNNTLPPARFDRSPLRTIPPTVLSSSPAPNKSGTAAIPVTPPVQNNEVSDSEGNGADVGTYTFRENLLSSKEWIFTDRKPDEAKKLLITTQSLIRPEDLQSAISAIVSTDEQLRKLGQRRTPNALLYNILRNLKSGDVTNTTFRKFLKIALYGKCFHFGAAKFSLFASEYYNDLDSSSVIKAYLRGCVFRLARLRPLSGSDAPWVSKLLLGDLSKDWEETTKELLLETLGGPNEKVLTDL